MGGELVKKEDYLILKSGEDIGALIRENVGDEDLTPFDLGRIKMPSGGGKAWEVPTLDGVDIAKEISGVIVGHFNKRVYWKEAFEDAGGLRPDCSSEDARTGKGDPSGDCIPCPFAQFGSAGKGQACKLVKLVFFVREGARLPMVIALPPTSLRGYKKYALGLADAGVPFWNIETVFGLEEAQNDAGIKYSKATFRPGRRLDEAAAVAMRTYKDAIQSSLQTIQVQPEDAVPV